MLALSGTVGETTLNDAQLANHSHKDADLWASSGYTKNIRYICCDINTGKSSPDRYTDPIGDSQSHTHSLSDVESSNGSNIPLFYALTYIIRVS